MEHDQQDLLQVSVNPAGAAAIRKIYKYNRYILGLGLTYSFLLFCLMLRRLSITHSAPYKNRWLNLESKLITPYSIIILLLGLTQFFYMIRWSKDAVKGIDSQDSERFNAAFAVMVRQCKVSLVTIALNVLFTLFEAFVIVFAILHY